MTNDRNQTHKRTLTEVNAILRANRIRFKAENLGDGNVFQIKADPESVKMRAALKDAGFILLRSTSGYPLLTFKTN